MTRMVDTVAVATGQTNGSLYCSMSMPSDPMTGIPPRSMSPALMAAVRPSDDGTTGKAKYCLLCMKLPRNCWPRLGSHRSSLAVNASVRPQIPPERLTLLITACIALGESERKEAPMPDSTTVDARLILVAVTPTSVAPPFWPAAHLRSAAAGPPAAPAALVAPFAAAPAAFLAPGVALAAAGPAAVVAPVASVAPGSSLTIAVSSPGTGLPATSSVRTVRTVCGIVTLATLSRLRARTTIAAIPHEDRRNAFMTTPPVAGGGPAGRSEHRRWPTVRSG